ncbi:MAG TPA: alpha/beta fold hydrolase [Burkholderiaceae bacterium]|nr:alpha/beta fold hydrolase [Burkholderiaceae bacterium]
MLARLQQLITIGLLLLAVSWALYFFQVGQPARAIGGALLIALGYALVLGIEFILLAFVQKGDPTPRPTIAQLLRAWWGEATTAPLVFCWRQPFRATAEPDHLPTARGRRGIVFVHGFFCNRAFWNPWMAQLRAEDVPFIAINLEPIFGPIGDYVSAIDAAVSRLEAATGYAPLIVAHSMGGLAVREWLHRTVNAHTRVHHVVTIGTPHHGTWIARWGRTINGTEMRLQSPLVTRLAAAGTAQRHALFTCFYSNCDNIVFPASTATLAGADNRHLPGFAHVQMAFQPPVLSEVWRLLKGPARDAPTIPAFRFKGDL